MKPVPAYHREGRRGYLAAVYRPIKKALRPLYAFASAVNVAPEATSEVDCFALTFPHQARTNAKEDIVETR
ncbi:hypothetical protein LBMAG21_07350 [Armatimonadota bacterium]|nr:hypothetical protein LBMAG21_07350 [Armatimonadota bacterium]